MIDRAKQALAKLVLEPEWEAKFLGCSHGFRPGRSTHDAIGEIFNSIKQIKGKLVLDADISGCFDNIDHSNLLEQIRTFPKMRRQVKAWLKAGVQIRFPKKELIETDKGTPQGGVISPLLANIALHSLDVAIDNISFLNYVRYADDFVILVKPEDKRFMRPLPRLINQKLGEVGLSLSPTKTRITDTLEGFDFLGFNVRQYEVGMYRSASKTNGKRLGIKTLIKPSKKSILKHYRKCAEIIRTHETAPKEALISKLNPVIRGWCNYYSHVVSKETFSKLDCMIFRRLMKMLHRKHSGQGSREIVSKNFETIGNRNWAFGNLLKHSKIPIVRHIKVKGDKSPFDGDLKYWGQRMKKGYTGLTKRQQYLLTQQKGKCKFCDNQFSIQDINTMEIDHIKPKALGGTNDWKNLQLLHRHCHDAKTAQDGSTKRVSTTRNQEQASKDYSDNPW
jgi:RNA-directed DNA polymerase